MNQLQDTFRGFDAPFATAASDCGGWSELPGRSERGQYFTPAWFAEELYDAHFSHLGDGDLLWEPSVGKGACLAAVPAGVRAIGTEIDPVLAAEAERRTGRRVIVGDCCTVPLPDGITAVFGNPLFDLTHVEHLLGRCDGFMHEGGKCVLILPAYFFQTSGTVVRLNRRWTIAQEFIPRDLFKWPKQMCYPVVCALFTRDNQPHLVGFRGYHLTSEIRRLPKESQQVFDGAFNGPRSVWRTIFATVLMELGGQAHLSDIYRKIEGRRPTDNPFWKEQLRKVAREYFRRVDKGVYALPAAA